MTQGIGVPASEAPVELEIESLAGGGRGVARDQGLVWLVLGGLPGDRVLALPTHRGRRHVEGIVTTVLRPSPLRREPPCPFQGTCGGCPWMGLAEEAQRDWKHRVVVDALARLGGFRDAVVDPVRASPRELGYRNKVELTIARGDEGAVVIGFHRAGEEALVDVDRCLLQDDAANAVLATVREFFHREEARADPIVKAGGDLARLMIRRSHAGRTLVGIRSLPGPFPSGPALARLLTERHPDVSGVVRILAQPGRRGGATVETLHGEPWIEETLAGTKFRLPADTFFQVNREAAEILAEVAVECAGDVAGKDVLELYGGVGAFSFALARNGARPIVVEADPDAVDCGREAARPGDSAPTFVTSDVLRFLQSPQPRGRKVHLVLADPPRTGLGRGVPPAILRLVPARIVLVSCDPATLARDAKDLAKGGFVLRRVVPVDLFPQTAEIETVALLVRAPRSER